ncbi:hypothetical protein BT69DRAFT_1332313 [Atractiella rhizophila]|nr:hypothetical protein BT69DRAFT_1332313 [Atractiella rhizophila]
MKSVEERRRDLRVVGLEESGEGEEIEDEDEDELGVRFKPHFTVRREPPKRKEVEETERVVVNLDDTSEEEEMEKSRLMMTSRGKTKEKGKERRREEELVECPLCHKEFHVDEIERHAVEELDAQSRAEQSTQAHGALRTNEKGNGKRKTSASVSHRRDGVEEEMHHAFNWTPPPALSKKDKGKGKERMAEGVETDAEMLDLEVTEEDEEEEMDVELQGTESDKDVGPYISDLPPAARAIYYSVLKPSSAQEDWDIIGLEQAPPPPRKVLKGVATKKWTGRSYHRKRSVGRGTGRGSVAPRKRSKK